MSEEINLRLSVSKVKTFSHCQKQYKFAYINKIPQKEFSFHSFGKFLHKILEDFHTEYINGCIKPYNIIMSRCFKSARKEYNISQDLEKEAYDIIKLYLKKIDKEFASTKILAVEKKFDINISNNIILNGMIDRIQLDNDNIIHVADYKTTKNKKYLKCDFLQLLTYAYVIFMENPTIEKIRGSYILLRHNFEYLTKEFLKDEILKIKEEYQDYAKKIEEELLWRPSPTRLCEYCSYLDICEEGTRLVKPQTVHGKISW